ncbi:MAG: MBL fold metallo-hydrolase [Alphaproteobacteria bacterium]|nr:MBL fold metallo-hydrolase [Alphaproteobacteria bacterium]
MHIQLIRSATVRITIGGITVLIDPWLADKGQGVSYSGEKTSPLVELPIPIEDVLDGVTAILISHLHTDHFDDVAKAVIDPKTPIFCHIRDANEIRSFGFLDVIEIDTSIKFGSIEIIVTEGRHGPPEILDEMGPVSGFVLKAPDEPVLYWAGDTILCDEVKNVIKSEEPDIIVVHSCGADWDGIKPLVMDIEMTLETVHYSQTATVIATHLDAVDHATVSRSQLRSAAISNPDAVHRLLIPEDGDIMEFIGTTEF